MVVRILLATILITNISSTFANETLLEPNEARFAFGWLLGKEYGGISPNDLKGYHYKAKIHDRLHSKVVKNLNSENLSLYLFYSFIDSTRGSNHSSFKEYLYSVFQLNPSFFLKELTRRDNRFMIPAVCKWLGSSYYTLDNSADIIDSEGNLIPGKELETIHKSDFAKLNKKDNLLCLKQFRRRQ